MHFQYIQNLGRLGPPPTMFSDGFSKLLLYDMSHDIGAPAHILNRVTTYGSPFY